MLPKLEQKHLCQLKVYLLNLTFRLQLIRSNLKIIEDDGRVAMLKLKLCLVQFCWYYLTKNLTTWISSPSLISSGLFEDYL